MMISSHRRSNNSQRQAPKQRSSIFFPVGIFLLGYAIGTLHHGAFLSATDDDYLVGGGVSYVRLLALSTAGDKIANKQVVEEEEDNGWKSIQVFRGKIQEPTSQSVWHSQAKQDELVVKLLKNKHHGFFVDLAANDAQKLSNTLALEKSYNWTGVCIEPNPGYWFDLTRLRTCQVVAAIVGSQDDRMEEIKFNYRGVYGGITRAGFDNGKKYEKESQVAYTVPLQEVLERTDTPRVIDYLSLDVEGAESYIMNNFPFANYQVKVMTVERPKQDLKDLLQEHGFLFMAKISRFGETLWVHRDFANDLELSPLARFQEKFPVEGVPPVLAE